VKTKWLSQFGCFHLPFSSTGVILYAFAVIFCLAGFWAFDRYSDSASDALQGIFPFFASTFPLVEQVAGKTSGPAPTQPDRLVILPSGGEISIPP